MTTYNPDGAASSRFSNPGDAVDTSPLRAWTYQLDPAKDGNALVGLVIHLPSRRVVHSIGLHTETPGMGVEFYGATGAPPSSITSPNWILLARRSSIDQSTTVTVKVKKALANLLVWITTAPPNTTVGKLDLDDLSVAG